MRMIAIASILAASVAGCATAPLPLVPPVVYACEGGLMLRVQFAHQRAHVTLPGGEELLLPQQRSGSGIAYGTPHYRLRGKGDAATWTAGDRKPVGCRVQR
jgi:membrane-bound inhibitor of C-type lysozyme